MSTCAARSAVSVATVSSTAHVAKARSTKPVVPKSGFRAALAPGLRLKSPKQTVVAHRQKALVVKAIDPAITYDLPAYPNPAWIEACAEEFPEYGMASIEQARVSATLPRTPTHAGDVATTPRGRTHRRRYRSQTTPHTMNRSVGTLFSPEIGYKYLDVRAPYEIDTVGK
eukprot:341489-Pyramimonas_sp.AAC.1